MPIESEIVCIRIISLAMHFISSFLSPKHLRKDVCNVTEQQQQGNNTEVCMGTGSASDIPAIKTETGSNQ